MFGNLTTIKSNHVEQPLVISDSSDSDSVHNVDNKPAKRPRHADSRTPPTLHACTAPPCPNCDEDTPSAAGSEFSTPEKVEIQITDESLVPVSPLTAQNPASIQVEIQTTPANADHPSGSPLRPNEDPADDPASTGVATLLQPPNLRTAAPRSDSHVGRQNRLMLNSLQYVFGTTNTRARAEGVAATQPDSDENDDEDTDEDADSDIREDDGEKPGSSTQAAASDTPNNPRPSEWDMRGDHPGMGWEVNYCTKPSYYSFLIPDPTVVRPQLIIAPYVSYSIHADHAEVSATYGSGYPIVTRPLVPTPVDYGVPAATHPELALLVEHPYAQAVTNVVDRCFPISLQAALKQYQHYQEEKYLAQAKTRRLERRLERAYDREYKFLEKAMGTLSEMENANFMGRLFAAEDEVLHELTAYPGDANSFIRTALNFKGTVTQSPCDPTPNLWRSKEAAAPISRRILDANAHIDCEQGDHSGCTHDRSRRHQENQKKT